MWLTKRKECSINSNTRTEPESIHYISITLIIQPLSLFFHRACCYRTLFKTPTHALCFKMHIKTQSRFKTLECLRLLCHPTCFGHTLDHLQGMFLVTMLLSAFLLRHNFTWVCGRIFCNIMFNNNRLHCCGL